MLITAAFLLLATLFLGITNLMYVLQHYVSSKAVPIIHGVLAVFAWFLVFLHLLIVGYTSLLLISFGLLTIAAMGGFTLLAHRLNHKRAPAFIVILHPLFAIAGLILLTITLLP